MKKKLTNYSIPRYPEEARHHGVSGIVVLRVLISVGGSGKGMQYVSGPRILAQATAEAVRQYKYQPTTENGQPVEVVTTVEANFEIRR